MDIEAIKNELVAGVNEFITNDAKNALLVWLRDTVLPAGKEVAATYTAKLKESAAAETGWNKFRDAIFLPVLIDGSIWAIGKVIDKIVPSTQPAEQETEQAAQ